MDKYKSCEGCPDRQWEPVNCHETCEGYLFRCEENRKKKELKRKDSDYDAFKKERVRETKKRIGMTK